MPKNYILDTNVLIHDPHSIFQFEDNNLYIPIYVLEELDKLKSERSLRGSNAREVCKLIDEIRCQGSLVSGVKVGKSTIIIYVPKERKYISVGLEYNSMDNAILQTAIEIKESFQDIRTILVTLDINLRIRAESIGVQAASYESQSVDPSRLISGQVTMPVSSEKIDEMFKNGAIQASECDEELFYNAYVTLQCGENRSALGKYYKTTNEVKPVKLSKEGILGIKPRNREQTFALDMLLDDSIQLVTLVGLAGTGKTLLALCAGMQKTVIEGKYNKLVVSRPVVPMGNDIGYLPGTLKEKLEPWMQPIYDNLELLMMYGGKHKTGMQYEDLFNQGTIRVEPLTYIRGRSLPAQFIIIDEAQNLTPHEIKTIITRCGEGSKIILTGDPDQIDNPYMDKGSCGLNVAVEKFHNHSIVGHLRLTKGERSELSNLAANVL